MKTKMRTVVVGISILVGGTARADTLNFVFPIELSQIVPAISPTGAFGSGTATLDTNTNLLSWDISFSGVTAYLAHFHGPAPIGVNAGVQVNGVIG